MELRTLLEHAQADLDWAKLDAIAKSFPENHQTFTTYLDAKDWLRKFWQEILRLQLHTSPPKRILDLGTGPGYFIYVCRYLGHEVLGLERPGTRRDEFHAWMEIPVIPHAIAARRALPRFPFRFDLVTSFRVPFNVKRDTGTDGKRELFDLEDWTFFLDDLRDNVLKPDGHLFMKMNTQSSHEGLHYGDTKLMQLFASRGAVAGEPKLPKLYVSFAPLR